MTQPRTTCVLTLQAEIRPQDDPTFSTPTEPGQPPRDRRPFDCQLANTLQLEVLVDCAYTWEHWYQENYLFYLIHISASGQDSRGWYKGIMDNLKGECKYKSECNEKAKMARSPVCFNNYLYGKQEVAGRTLYGLEAAFEMKKWDPGDDNTHCIERAIRKASCDGRVTFQNGTCYKRYGSYQYPFDIQGPLSKGNK
jgi:hypothetical protein